VDRLVEIRSWLGTCSFVSTEGTAMPPELLLDDILIAAMEFSRDICKILESLTAEQDASYSGLQYTLRSSILSSL
jgi:hypothetical protein